MKRLLLIRVDKIGDLICTLPVDQHPDLSEWTVDWWIPKGLAPLVARAEPARKTRELSRRWSGSQFWQLYRELRRLRPEAAVVFQGPWWIGLLLVLAGVPVRAGVLSQWHSFLFFNRGLRQKRSLAEKHEFEYGRELLESALGLAPLRNQPTLKLRSLGTAGNYLVLHPGMAGSARNWPGESYLALMERLLAKGWKVVVTGGPSDAPFVDPLRAKFGASVQVEFRTNLSFQDWIDVLGSARAVVAPSTGAVHVAASLGIPTLGLYSPVRVQRALRWGPRGPRVRVLTPQVDCPGTLSCWGPRCSIFDCMKQIEPEKVESALNELIGDSTK